MIYIKNKLKKKREEKQNDSILRWGEGGVSQVPLLVLKSTGRLTVPQNWCMTKRMSTSPAGCIAK